MIDSGTYYDYEMVALRLENMLNGGKKSKGISIDTKEEPKNISIDTEQKLKEYNENMEAIRKRNKELKTKKK